MPEHGAYRVNILIGEPHLWGKGLGTDILRTVLEYCFFTLHHRSVYALDVDPFNLRALRLYTRFGFLPYNIEKRQRAKGGFIGNVSLRVDDERYSALRGYLQSLPY